MPFSSTNSPTTYRAAANVSAYTGLVTSGLQVTGQMNNNINKINIRGVNNNAQASTFTRANLNSGGWEIMITCTYHTDS